MAANARNLIIVLALAALVALIPGGGTGANVAIQAVSLAFLAAIAWAAMVSYRERRLTLYSLGDTRRGILYAAAGAITLTLSASTELWRTVGGKIAWFLLLAAALYAGVAVVWSARRL